MSASACRPTLGPTGCEARPPFRVSYPWELVLLLSFAFFFHQADRAIFGVVLGDLRVDMALTDSQIGLIGSVLFLTLSLMMPLAGLAADAWPKERVIAGCLIFWSTATGLTGCATGPVGLVLLCGVATAAGEAFYTPAAYALLARHHRQTRGLALSIHQAALYLGVMSCGFLGGWLAQNWGWRAAFHAFGAGGIVLGLVLCFRLRPDRTDASRVPEPILAADTRSTKTDIQPPALRRALRVLFQVPTAVLLTVSFTAIVFVNNAYVVWAPEFLREKGVDSLALAGGYAMFFHHLAAMAGVLAGGWLSDRWVGQRPSARLELQIAALAVGAPALVWMGLASGVAETCTAMSVLGLCRGLYESNTHATLFDVIPPRCRGSAVAAMVMVAFLLGSLSPWLLGRARDAFPLGQGLAYGFASLGGVYVLGSIALIVARSRYFPRDRIDRD